VAQRASQVGAQYLVDLAYSEPQPQFGREPNVKRYVSGPGKPADQKEDGYELRVDMLHSG
jgi:hypothetical protein